MTVHELWNSIIFRIFKTSLTITPPLPASPPKAPLWRIAYKNPYVTHPKLILFNGEHSGYCFPSQHSYSLIFLIVKKSRYNQNCFWRTFRVYYLNKCVALILFWDLHYGKSLKLPICCFPWISQISNFIFQVLRKFII